MRKILLELSYLGGAYAGFQVQKNARSVCETLQDALAALYGVRPPVKGCSRTDAGVQLTVQDNGVGISQEDLDRIWQRFYQADPSRQESAGLGLGLSMVQQIVALHGGTVAVASVKGRGTTFTVTLPEHHGKEEK